MKIYLAFELEGCTGGSMWAQMHPHPTAPSAYPRMQRLATGDIKAAIEGILEIDPEADILFNDGHGPCTSIFYEEFPENVSAVTNAREYYDEVLGLDDSFDALICIGAHGHNLIADTVLSHNWYVNEVKFNGKLLTETGLNATLAGYYGIPLVAVSGDEDTMRYIQKNISPKIAVASVKKGIGRNCAICLHPKKTKKIIKEAVIDGLKRRKEISPLTFDNPVTVEITWPDNFSGHAINYFIGDESISATKTKFIADNAKEAYRGFLTRQKLGPKRPF